MFQKSYLVLKTDLAKKYILWKRKINKNRKNIELFKFAIVGLIFLISVFVYGYFVNIGSTKGYFLRQYLGELEDVKLDFQVVELKYMKQISRLNEELNSTLNNKISVIKLVPKNVK